MDAQRVAALSAAGLHRPLAIVVGEQGEIDVGGKSLGRPQGDEVAKKSELIAEIITHFSL